MGFQSTKTKTRRCTLTAFSYILDMVITTVCIIFAMNKKDASPKEQDTFKLLHNFIRQMVEPTISKGNLNGLE